MTDADLIAKKLAFIESCVQDLRTLARPEAIARDVREERFVEHTLQLAIQAALDVASHIVSDERLGEPRANRERPRPPLRQAARRVASQVAARVRRRLRSATRSTSTERDGRGPTITRWWYWRRDTDPDSRFQRLAR